MSRPLAVLLALGVLLGPRAGAADDSLRVADPGTAPAVRAGRLPSPGTAALLSNAAVALPIIASSQLWKHADSGTRSDRQFALVATAVVAGPAVGYLYGDCARRGLIGAGARMAAAGVVIAMVGAASDLGEGGGAVVIPAAAVGALVVGSAIWDMATVVSTVEARNRARAAVGVRVGAAPFSGAPGLLVGLRW